MVLLENDLFLNELTKLYIKTKNSGTVFITFKRYNNIHEKEGKKKSNIENDYKCLIRATDGKHIKISTLVNSKDVVRFQLAFSNILKTQMENLKRKEKKKKSKKATV